MTSNTTRRRVVAALTAIAAAAAVATLLTASPASAAHTTEVASRWACSTRTLTYTIHGGSPSQRAAIARGVTAAWSSAGYRVRPVATGAKVDVRLVGGAAGWFGHGGIDRWRVWDGRRWTHPSHAVLTLNRSLSASRLRWVAAHEAGHAIGAEHVTSRPSIMALRESSPNHTTYITPADARLFRANGPDRAGC